MTPIEELPLWAEILVSLFLLLGSGVTLIGCTGLVRFKTFYERIHAPTLGSTLARSWSHVLEYSGSGVAVLG